MELLNWVRRRLDGELGSLVDLAAAVLEEETRTAAPRREPQRTARKGTRGSAPSADDCWVPAGQAVAVGGYEIEGGMLYVGQRLPAVSRYPNLEPALINPRLLVAKPGKGEDFYYWYARSYSDMTPGRRAQYLAWLAGGRRDPNVPVGFVNLFFYGLERRLLADTKHSPRAWDDADAIVAEVERLADAYPSFRHYATEFLGAVKLVRAGGERLYEGPPPKVGQTYDLPMQLRVGLGQLSADKKPIPAEWALAWLRANRDSRLSTAATRCPEEFEHLFLLRYREELGEGLVLKPNKRRLRASYRPASPGLGGVISLPVGDLPDVSGLRATVQKLEWLAYNCSRELDPLSRWLARNPDGKNSLGALARTPREVPLAESVQLRELRAWLHAKLGGAETARLDGGELATRWNRDAGGKLTNAEAGAFLNLLERVGCGAEPDPRHGGPPLGQVPVVLFRLPDDSPAQPSRPYEAASAVLQLGVAVGCADGALGEPERRQLAAYVEALPDVADAERRRLRAHLAWRAEAGAKLTGLKHKLADFSPAQRTAVGRFLVSVGAADGPVTPAELTLLGKVYRMLELDTGELYSDVHALATAATEPVTVREAGEGGAGYRIPAPPAPGGSRVVLDSERVERKLADSAAVSALLGAIFEEEEAAPIAETAPAAPSPGDDVACLGLDAAHSSLLRALAGRPGWARAEVEALAGERGLLPDGALETINDAALEASGEPAFEGDDPIEVNTYVLEELLR